MTTKPGKKPLSLSAKRNATGGESGSGNRNCVPLPAKLGAAFALHQTVQAKGMCFGVWQAASAVYRIKSSLSGH